ncbi:MAG TPA: glycine cleavage system protein GcvH [Chloroflexi bacterium]|jgi:glycine cleavage system H protein|nr:glycine cleavage system protein GcvH [Chloroflexota bacterium]HAF19334.1 glycine cleavage system protein GcvH [Chloroflexota bacterium]
MAGRLYTKSHEWLTVDGKTVTVGITDFAQSQLGDVVFLELPKPGRKLDAGESFGVVESVKAASDLYSPVSGRVATVNEQLAAKPELINSDPYGDGWILKLELTGELPTDLMDEAAYKKSTESQA